MHVRASAHVHACTSTHLHKHTGTLARTLARLRTRTCTPARMHWHIRTYMCTGMHTLASERMHVWVSAYIDAHVHVASRRSCASVAMGARRVRVRAHMWLSAYACMCALARACVGGWVGACVCLHACCTCLGMHVGPCSLNVHGGVQMLG